MVYDERVFFLQAEDGIRYLVRSRGLGDVYKRQELLVRRHARGGNAGGQHQAPRPAVREPDEGEADELSLIHI